MTPDGAVRPCGATDPAYLHAPHAILLHGGRALLLFEGAEAPPPRHGELVGAGGARSWTAECWRVEAAGLERWCGLAVLDALPAADAELLSPDDARRWRFASAPRVDIAPQPLADLVRKGGVDQRAVFDFLVRRLIAGRPSDCAEAQAHLAFARGFFTAAAERDGFIEILAAPECGGLFAQGWSLSLAAGPEMLASVAGELAVHPVEVAHFEREDILPPGRGFCVFGKGWRSDGAMIDAVFFEKDGRLLRLDVVPGAVARLDGAAATGHAAQMLPRLAAPTDTLRAFRRICRPRYAGEDTISGAAAPIALGFDAVLHAPDGGLFLTGWMLDPLRLARLALVKSDAGLYAQLQDAWVRLPRPDLCAGFASDPRFAGLLDPEDALHGFLVHVPAQCDRIEGARLYVELVLADESCLFRPLTPTPLTGAERLPQILAFLSPSEPELGRIVEEHLTPFLAAVSPTAAAAPHDVARPIPLGAPGAPRPVSAVMPVRGLGELQPVLALLAGTPEAAAMDLLLVAPRAAAADMLKPLGEAFCFYGLRGALVLASNRATFTGRLDAGVAASEGARVLAWSPAALPREPGWLARLIAEADALPAPGLISPAMTYEDGSVYLGAPDAGDAGAPAAGSFSPVAGYGPDWLVPGAPVELAAGAAEIALIDRATLARAGGFAGRLFSDVYARLDLAHRLRRLGAGAWCSRNVRFWMLEDAADGEGDPFARLMERVDATLVARRAADARGAAER